MLVSPYINEVSSPGKTHIYNIHIYIYIYKCHSAATAAAAGRYIYIYIYIYKVSVPVAGAVRQDIDIIYTSPTGLGQLLYI